MHKVTFGIARAIVVASALWATACRQSPASPSDTVKSDTILVQGVARTYLLHVPATFQSGSGGLVVALPGRTESALFFQSFTNLNTKADQEGFAVAYADGLFQPASGALNWAYYRNDFVDDVSFLRELIAALQAQL